MTERFATGGILPHGPATARNDTETPEPVVSALDIPQARPGRLIVTIGESADAVLRAAEPQTARCSSCRRRIWRVGFDGAWRSEDCFGCPATGKAHRAVA